MDEARRFLRYVLPGLVFGVETILWLLIVFPVWTCSQLKTLDSLGPAIVSVLASGALGYIFAMIHHWCHWYLWCDWEILNHVSVVNPLLATKLDPKKRKDREKAWEMSLALWYQRVKKDGSITEAADKKLISLGDMAHGLGTARVASAFSLVAATIIWLVNMTNPGFIWSQWVAWSLPVIVVLWLIVVLLFHDAYKRVGKNTQGLYDKILGDELVKEGKIPPTA